MTFEPGTYLNFRPSGHSTFQSINANIKWVEPPDTPLYSVQLNALSKDFWAQVVFYPDGDLITYSAQLWKAERFAGLPNGDYQGTGDLIGSIWAQMPESVITSKLFAAGQRSITIGCEQAFAFWEVFDVDEPLWTTWVYWKAADVLAINPSVAHVVVVNDGPLGFRVFKTGKAIARIGFDCPVSWVNDIRVLVGDDWFSNATGEQSNMCHTVQDAVDINLIEESIHIC